MILGKKLLVALLASAAGTEAFWRMVCHGRTGIARIDPIVSPGKASQHAHSLHGSSGMSFTADYNDLQAGNCTSCSVTEDKSGYWHPMMYFKHSNGTIDMVPQVGGMLAYYFLNADAANPNGTIKAFPEGFRMLAGDSTRRNCTINDQPCPFPDPPTSSWAALGEIAQPDLEQRAIGFNCLHYTAGWDEPTLYRHFLPPKAFLDLNCTDGLRMELMFPSCWDGQNLDSPDHKSHVAYPDLVMAGACPSGYNVKLPALFYEVIYATYVFNESDGEFVFANGDPTGYGYHGDFIMGWQSEDFLQSAVTTCTNSSGQISDCPLFDIQPDSDATNCFINTPAPIADEAVSTDLAHLPGRVAIQSGPQPANPGAPTPSTTALATSSSSSSALSLAQGAPTPTVVAAVVRPDSSPAETYTAVSTEYITRSGLVEEVVYVAPVFVITTDVAVTETLTATASATMKRRHMHAHAHHHHGVHH